jgi:hypothetical protein
LCYLEDGELKVKEKNVVCYLAPIAGKEGKAWAITGSGENDYGKFTIAGEYRAKADSNKFRVEKQYTVTSASNDDSDDDSDLPDDSDADPDELEKLEEEANMSVDELRARYSAKAAEQQEEKEKNGGGADGGGAAAAADEEGQPSKKKAKKEEVEESEDEGEGF